MLNVTKLGRMALKFTKNKIVQIASLKFKWNDTESRKYENNKFHVNGSQQQAQ